MILVNALVSEDPPQFIDLIKAADNQPLQVKFGGNAQIKALVQGIVVGVERAGVGAGGHRNQDGSIHFEEAPSVKKSANTIDYSTPLGKSGHYLRVGNQVQVTLPVADFHVSQPVPLLRQGTHSLGQQGNLVSLYGNLTGARSQQGAGNPEKVAQVQVFEQFIVLIQHILPEHSLNCSRTVAEVQKGGPSHNPHGHYAPAEGLKLRLRLRLRRCPAIRVILTFPGFSSLKCGNSRSGVGSAPKTRGIGVNAPLAQAV